MATAFFERPFPGRSIAKRARIGVLNPDEAMIGTDDCCIIAQQSTVSDRRLQFLHNPWNVLEVTGMGAFTKAIELDAG